MADSYPKTKYAVSGGSVLVISAEQEKMLGPGWVDHKPIGVSPPPQTEPQREPIVEAPVFAKSPK